MCAPFAFNNYGAAPLLQRVMKAILGQKIGMSQVFSQKGEVVPVTLVHAWPNTITLRRTELKDGFNAIQVAFPRKQESGKTSQENGMKPREQKRVFFMKKEFKGIFPEDTVQLEVSQFAEGDVVQVTGISKGKGFAGVVKRHHFKGGPKSHGHRHVLRRPGSIGSRFPQHVLKGRRMAGRMGHDQVTVKNLTVVKIDAAHNILAIRGAVPGARGSIVAVTEIENGNEKKENGE